MSGSQDAQSLRHSKEWLLTVARDPRVAGVCAADSLTTCLGSELAAYLRFSLPAVVGPGRVRVDVAWVRHDPTESSDFMATQSMQWSLVLQDRDGAWAVVHRGPRLLLNRTGVGSELPNTCLQPTERPDLSFLARASRGPLRG